MLSITEINRIIQESRNKHEYCQYNDHKLKPLRSNGHIFWIDINDGISIYCDEEASAIFEKEIGLHSPFTIKTLPQDIIKLHNAINHFHLIVKKFPSHSSSAADFGNKLSFKVALLIGTICEVHGQELSNFKETNMAIKTQGYGLNVLVNWKKFHDFNQLNKTEQEEYKLMMAKALYKMAIYNASLSNWAKTLCYCKDALTFTDLPRIKELRDDTLNHIDRFKKFENLIKNK